VLCELVLLWDLKLKSIIIDANLKRKVILPNFSGFITLESWLDERKNILILTIF